MNGGGRGLCKGIVFLTKRHIFCIIVRIVEERVGYEYAANRAG